MKTTNLDEVLYNFEYTLYARLYSITQDASTWYKEVNMQSISEGEHATGKPFLYSKKYRSTDTRRKFSIPVFTFCFVRDLDIPPTGDRHMTVKHLIQSASDKGILVNDMSVIALTRTGFMGCAGQVLAIVPQGCAVIQTSKRYLTLTDEELEDIMMNCKGTRLRAKAIEMLNNTSV